MKSATVALTVDPELRDLIPALSSDERRQLEANLIADGCLTPIIVWANHDDTILDGHNRYEICVEHNIAFKTKALKFDTREAAERWLIDNQLGRRNLSEAQRDYLLGKRYELEKDAHGGDRKSIRHGDGLKGETAERIANEQGVSARTVERAADFAHDVDAIGEVAPEAKAAILSGDVKGSRKDVAAVAELPKAERKKVAKAIASGEVASVREAMDMYEYAEASYPAEEQEPDEVLDQLGNRVSEDHVAAFASLSTFQQLESDLRDIKRLILALAKEPGGAFINTRNVSAGIKQALDAVSSAEPYTTCPYCEGHGCDGCLKTGWVCQLAYEQAPEENK